MSVRLSVCQSVRLPVCQWVWSQCLHIVYGSRSVAQQSSLNDCVCHKKGQSSIMVIIIIIILSQSTFTFTFTSISIFPHTPSPPLSRFTPSLLSLSSLLMSYSEKQSSVSCLQSTCPFPLRQDNIFCNKFLTASMRPRMSCALHCVGLNNWYPMWT